MVKKKVYDNKYFPTSKDPEGNVAPEMPMYDPSTIAEIARQFGGGSVNPAIQQYGDLLQKIQGQNYGANSQAMINRLEQQISGLQGRDLSSKLFGQGNQINNWAKFLGDPTGAARQGFNDQRNALSNLSNTDFTSGLRTAQGQQENYLNNLMSQDFSGALRGVLGDQRGFINDLRNQDVTGGYDKNIANLIGLAGETRGLRDASNADIQRNRNSIHNLYGNIAKETLPFGQDYLTKASDLINSQATTNAENARRKAIESMNARGLGAGAAENVSILRQNDLNRALTDAYNKLSVDAESGRADAISKRDAQLAQLLGLDANALGLINSNNANLQNNILGAYNAINSAIGGRESANASKNNTIANMYGQLANTAKGIGDIDLNKYGLGQDARSQINSLAQAISQGDISKAGLLQSGTNALANTGVNIGNLTNGWRKTQLGGMTAAGDLYGKGYDNNLAQQGLVNQLLGQQNTASSSADRANAQSIVDQMNAISGASNAFANDQRNRAGAISDALRYYGQNQEGYKTNANDYTNMIAAQSAGVMDGQKPQTVPQNTMATQTVPQAISQQNTYKPIDMSGMNLQLRGITPKYSPGNIISNIPDNRLFTTVTDQPTDFLGKIAQGKQRKATTSFATQPPVYF